MFEDMDESKDDAEESQEEYVTHHPALSEKSLMSGRTLCGCDDENFIKNMMLVTCPRCKNVNADIESKYGNKEIGIGIGIGVGIGNGTDGEGW